MDKAELEEGGLTAVQLIAQLSLLPPDTVVLIEGCDCTGPAGNVEPNGYNDGVIITRADLARKWGSDDED